MSTTSRRRGLRALGLAIIACVAAAPAGFAGAAGIDVYADSAHVAGHTVTYPLYEGVGPAGVPTWFIVIEASDGDVADRYGVNVVDKLDNTGAGAQRATVSGGRLVFEGGVDFSPTHVVQGSATGFPPLAASPGSIGDDAYSPIVRLPDGTHLNAPQVANATGVHDKVVAIDYAKRTVTLALTDGFSRDDAVLYLSTDASAPDVAALEGSTYAPRLAAAPSAGDDSTGSSRASLAAFLNGPTGSDNPQRQGVNSALLGEGDPLNVLAWKPNQGRYSPLWDVHLSVWADPNDARRVTSFDEVADLADDGSVVGAGGSAWVANDVVVNCPIIAEL
jgi:hypothetical protein